MLKSINWSLVKFDVLCIETDPPNRPSGYADKVTKLMQEHGYLDYSGQVGRNICKFLCGIAKENLAIYYGDETFASVYF